MTTPARRILLLRIDKIRLDGGTQSRAEGLDEATVEEYVAALDRKEELPVPVVFYDGQHYFPGDGFHTIEAHRRKRARSILCEVRNGGRRHAILYSVGANARHGLPRSAEDKRYAVGLLLADPEWGAWSDTEISHQCVVSRWLVREVRAARLSCANAQDRAQRKVKRGGTTYAMKTPSGGKRDLPAEEAEALRLRAIEEARENLEYAVERLARAGANVTRALGLTRQALAALPEEERAA